MSLEEEGEDPDYVAPLLASTTRIEVQVPEGVNPGLAILKVVNPDGQAATTSIEIEVPLDVNEIQPSLVQAEASTRFFLSGTGFSSDITLIEFEPEEDDSPGVGFGPLPKITECTDLAVLSSTSATCTATYCLRPLTIP